MIYCSLLPVTYMTMMQIIDVIGVSDKYDVDSISTEFFPKGYYYYYYHHHHRRRRRRRRLCKTIKNDPENRVELQE